MPGRCHRCARMFSTTDYSPGDFAALLQAGTVQLLDVETLMALRNDESVIRWGLSRLQRYQKLSDELIVPRIWHRTLLFSTIPPRGNCENPSRDCFPKLCKPRCNSRTIWIEPTASYSNASRPSGIAKENENSPVGDVGKS